MFNLILFFLYYFKQNNPYVSSRPLLYDPERNVYIILFDNKKHNSKKYIYNVDIEDIFFSVYIPNDFSFSIFYKKNKLVYYKRK